METKDFNEAIETINRKIRELELKKKELISENSKWFVMRISTDEINYYVGMGRTLLSEAEKRSKNILDTIDEYVYDYNIFAVREDEYALYRKWKWSEEALEYCQCYLSGTGIPIYEESKPQLEENIANIKSKLLVFRNDKILTEQFVDW